MNKKYAIEQFGGAAKLAKALGIQRQAVYQWPDELTPRTSNEIIGAMVAHKMSLPDSCEAIIFYRSK